MNYEKYGEIIIPPEADLKLPTNNNSRYFYNNKIKELVLDIAFNDHSEDKPREFQLKLPDPLIIDVEHDIYLDSVITYNLRSALLMRNMAFAIFIDQFNIQTKVATNIKQIDTEGDIGSNTSSVIEGKVYRLISKNLAQDAGKAYLRRVDTNHGTSEIIDTIPLGTLCVGASGGGTFTDSKVQEVGTQAQHINKLNNAIIIPNEKTHENIETLVIQSTTSTNITLASTPTTNIQGEITKCLIHTSKDGHTTVFGVVQTQSDATLTISGMINVVNGQDISAQDLHDATSDGVDIIQIFNEHNNHSTIHKGRKHNYVGTITPSKLVNITGSISDVGEYIVTTTSVDSTEHFGSEIKFRSPFRDRITSDGTGAGSAHHHNLERMIVEFKLVPRQ
tara:strand:- start:266 stop:1438 length:1173 start_codon:yes stop_codon:yes gene_type:complete